MSPSGLRTNTQYKQVAQGSILPLQSDTASSQYRIHTANFLNLAKEKKSDKKEIYQQAGQLVCFLQVALCCSAFWDSMKHIWFKDIFKKCFFDCTWHLFPLSPFSVLALLGYVKLHLYHSNVPFPQQTFFKSFIEDSIMPLFDSW